MAPPLRPEPFRPVRPSLWLLLPLLTGATLLAYAGSFSGPFVFDDVAAIPDNVSLRHWSQVLFPPAGTTAGGRPLLNLSFALNHALSGNAVRSYHWVNWLIHALAALTLFGLLRRTFARLTEQPVDLLAFAAALVWALHPLQTESVTYLVQRAESLMGLFYLLALYAFSRGAAQPAQSRWWAISLLACWCGMATKEVMVSAPVIILLYDRAFWAGTCRQALLQRPRYYAALALSWLMLLITAWTTHGRAGSAGFGSGTPFVDYAAVQCTAICRYLKLTVWPDPLVFYYGIEPAPALAWVVPAAGLLLALLAASVAAWLRPSRSARAAGFAGLWFFAILAPTSLIPIKLETSAEHRMYLALVPLIAALLFALAARARRWAVPCGLGWAAVLLVLTWIRNQDYRSALVLWQTTAAHAPAAAEVHYNLAVALEQMPGRSAEAIEEYRRAAQLRPDFAAAHLNLGSALATAGQSAEAAAELQQAVALSPLSPKAHNDLGNALARLPGRLPEAEAQYRAALRLQPSYPEAHDNLGNVLSAEARPAEAVAEHVLALQLSPEKPELHYNLGNALARLPGRLDEAAAQYREALRLQPDYVQAENNLAGIAMLQQRYGEALTEYTAVVARQPNFAAAHLNLAVALLKSGGDTSAARQQLETVLQLQPDNTAARRILAQLP